MKKIYDLCRTSVLYALFACACSYVAGCSNEDEDGDFGAGNTTDIAVTGNPFDITSNSASIKGYVNVDKTWALLMDDFGIEYSTNSDFSYPVYKRDASAYTGREFSVNLYDLKPGTTYYYRTYVHAGMYYYGKTQSFKTKDVNVRFTVQDISYTKATITWPESDYSDFAYFYQPFTFYYTTKPNAAADEYEYISEVWEADGKCTITDLEPNTTYYCYLVGSSGQKSDSFNFKTKSLPFDLSGTSVKCTYKPLYNSYVNWRGITEDLKWLGGTYKITITSNAGNQYKYGMVMSGEGYGSGTYYSTDTDSPYTITATYKADSPWVVERIEVLLDLVKSGDACDDDLYELYASLEEVKKYSGALYPYLYAFIEIDGERIYVGNTWHIYN